MVEAVEVVLVEIVFLLLYPQESQALAFMAVAAAVAEHLIHREMLEMVARAEPDL